MNEGAAEVKSGYTKLSGNRALTSYENRVLCCRLRDPATPHIIAMIDIFSIQVII